MPFVNPSGLWLLGALAPLLALYLLGVRRQRRTVPSTWLWREAQRDLLAQKPFRRFLSEVPLVLEAAAIVALALALAQPSHEGSVVPADHVAIVVDTSASMSAKSAVKKTRFEEARRAVRDVLSRLPSGAEVIVVDAGREPRAATALEREPRRVAAAVDRLAPRDEDGDLPRALALAAERLERSSGARRIVLITDVNADVPSSIAVPLDVVRVGAPADNVAIARFELRRATDPVTGRESASAFVLLQNFGDEAATRFVTLRRRERAAPLASRRVELSPGERVAQVLSFDVSPEDTGKGVVAELSPGDALRVDDQAVALLPPGPRLPVVLVPPEADPWLRRALAADSSVELYETTFDGLSSGKLPPDALVVATFGCPKTPPPGDVLVIAPPPGDCLGTRVGELVHAPLVTSWAEGDPRFRFLTLTDLDIEEARALDAPRGSELLRAGNATLAADLGLVHRSGTVVSFDPGRSDWPLRASFVLFVRNVTELSRANRARRASVPQHTGEMLRIPLSSAEGRVRLRGPDGEHPARLLDGTVLSEAASRVGFYDVLGAQGNDPLATVAVNLASDGESNLRRKPTAASGAVPSPVHEVARGAARSASWPFALFAVGCLLAEVLWLGRTRSHAPLVQLRASVVVHATTLLTAVAISAYALLLQKGVLREGPVRFGRPEATLAGVLAALVLSLSALRGTAAARASAPRRVLFEALVAMSVLSAALLAADPYFGVRVDRMAVIVAADRSRSMDLSPDASARIEREMDLAGRGMRQDDRLGVVAFASEAALEEPLRTQTEPRSSQTAPLGRDGTNVAAGVRRALAEAPADAATRIVVVSDGVATEGDTLNAALTAALAGIPVDVLPIEQVRVPNVRVQALHAPARADSGEAFDLRVTTRAATDTDVDVRVSADGDAKSAGRRHIHAGEDVFWIREEAARPGIHRYDVHLSPVDPRADSIAADNDGAAFVRVTGPSRALIIEEPSRAAPIRAALAGAAFDVDVVGATRAPTGLDDLARHDLIVLGNVPAEDLSTEQVEELATYVRDLGGGLLLLGGDRSMGPGGYAKTPLEEVSPLSFEVPNERRRTRLAEVIAIDTSGSMAQMVGGQTKLALANEAAARSAGLLGPGDRVAVEHVDTGVTWTVPMQDVSSPVDIGRRIRSAGPGGGGIFIDDALEAAYGALQGKDADQQHVLLFSDGNDAENRERAPDLVRSALRRGITTSVVALGQGQDAAALERLSRDGKGRFYLVEDAARLPSVFARETTIAAGNSVRNTTFRAAPGTPDAATRGIDLPGAPELTGYLVTTPKPRAETSLYAADRDPLLSTWAVGEGRAGAFTSDYGGRWGGGWAAWADAAKLFAQLGRDLSRRADDASVTLEADVSGGSLAVRARAVSGDGSDDSFRRLTATVAGPDGFSRVVPLEVTGPGSYAASLGLGHPGAYVAEVRDDATRASVGTTGAVLSAGAELEPTGTDRALLARIARVTGGRVLQHLEGVFADRPPQRRTFRALLPWLALTSALSLLLAVAARRLSIPAPALGPVRGAPRPAPTEAPLPVAPSATPPTPAMPAITEELLRRRRRRQ